MRILTSNNSCYTDREILLFCRKLNTKILERAKDAEYIRGREGLV